MKFMLSLAFMLSASASFAQDAALRKLIASCNDGGVQVFQKVDVSNALTVVMRIGSNSISQAATRVENNDSNVMTLVYGQRVQMYLNIPVGKGTVGTMGVTATPPRTISCDTY